MQIGDDLFEELFIACVLGDLFEVVLGEHARYLTTAQQVVDVLQE